MTGALGVALALPGAAVAVLATYLLVLALASLTGRTTRRSATSQWSLRLAVLVPAHDEEQLVARCVASLLGQTYPRALYRVVVIADNCSDRTAAVAEAAGAEVMVRNEPDARGKGRALRWAVDRLLAESDAPDAVAVVDADSIADPDLLAALAAEAAGGHAVVQGDYTILVDETSSARTRLVAAGFLLFHRVRFGGRARLGMSANLVGNGMLFSSSVLKDHPWRAFSAVEDLEHSVDLRLDGIGIRFAPDAFVAGPMPVSGTGELKQRMRWEGGRFNVVRTRLPELVWAAVSRRQLRLLDAALDLATPPLGLLTLVTGGGAIIVSAAAVTGLLPRWAAVPWLFALVAIAAFVGVGLHSARAPRSVWRAIGRAPFYLAWKLVTYTRLLRGFDANRWDRSDRRVTARADRVEIAGVPIDPIDIPAAVDRIEAAVNARTGLLQVATVNLDFLVRGQRDPDMRGIFRRTGLNLADGAPVVWLGRLLGVPIPGRVAGADLVPAIFSALARSRARVFLLGGENDVAGRAAVLLPDMYPGLEIAGTYEPPRAAITEMNNTEILERIAESRADLLLVAFGNPKQERWIDLHRDQLSVPVAIGVGCVLDLIAGRSRRAPRWMQESGLEWLYRLLQEPRRLVGRYALDAAWLIPLAMSVVRARVAGKSAETA